MSARPRRARTTRRPPPRAGAAGARARRGSVTVIAGMFMLGLTGFGAIAIDASRLFTVRSEMQTLVDAAALAGAIQMLEDSSVAVDSATAYATRNGYRRGVDEGASDGDALRTWEGVWSPATRTFIEDADPADAIRVAVWRRVPFILSHIFGTTGVQLEARAIAWAGAPVSGSSECVKPLMLPFDYVRQLVNPPSSEMTADDMRRLRELTEEQRTDSFRYGNGEADPAGKYFAVTLPPVVRADGQPMETSQGNYQEYIANCRSTQVSPGDWLVIVPTNHRSQTVNGMRELCEQAVASGGMGGEFSGGQCFVGGSARGIPLKVAFWDSAPIDGPYGFGAVQVKMMGSFVMTNIDAVPDPTTGVERATIRGHLTTGRDHGPVGTGPSMLRRAIIVE